MIKYMTLIICFSYSILCSQTLSDFENYDLPIDSFLNGSEVTTGYSSGNIFLPNKYQDFGAFESWSGWGISTSTDNVTPGFINQQSSISGSGYNGSKTYAVSYVVGQSIIELTNNSIGKVVDGFYINNNAYAYYSMLDGDAYAKKFGGETGNDPDYLLLTIKSYLNGTLSSDSINFYLADYRFEDNKLDYIVKDWTFIDLKPLGNVDSLIFSMSSTDVSSFGLNTPAYFCLDNFRTLDISTSVESILDHTIAVYPNPSTDIVNIKFDTNEERTLTVFNQNGKFFKRVSSTKQLISINTTDFIKGQYFISVKSKQSPQSIISIIKI
ncbi:MAG: DUF4465 domain-containing protein [Saprospiraceae bacterium]|nr:DUF4465 domain-containing protein [Saprospiraceae bacterium]